MSKSLVSMIGFASGFALFFLSCGGDDMDDFPSIDIPLAFLSPMAAGDYTIRITITAADIPNQIVEEQNLAIVEGRSQTYEVTVNDVPVGNRREVKVEVFKTGNRLFVGSGTANISSGGNQLAMRLEKVAELLSSEPKAGAQILSSGSLTLNFSAPPGVVTVNGRHAVVQGHAATWSPSGLAPGPTTLNIAWTVADGSNDTLQLVIIGSPAIINILPSAATLTALGDTIQLNAIIKDGKNQSIPGATMSWSSSNPSVASVSADGLITALGNGTAAIKATSGGASTTVAITVTQASAAVNITPASAKLIALGDTIQLSATVKDKRNQLITGAIRWSSSNPLVVSVSPRGLVTARRNGRVNIIATSGAESSIAIITVVQLPTTIEIRPVSLLPIVAGQTLQLSAAVHDHNNNLIASAEINWASSNPSVADISPTGLVTARSNGRTTVIASSGGLSQLVTITVPDTTGPSVVSGTVSHGAKRVNIGPINAGGFRFDFDEPIIGSIKLTDEAGRDLNWIANVLGQTATLTVVPGKELVESTTYKIEIDVKDGADNKTKQTIIFVTDLKR